MSLTLIIVAIVIVVYGILLYNRIVHAENMAKRGWADVITYERNKLKVIPKLEELTTQYQDYEQAVLSHITEMRQALNKLDKDKVDVTQLQHIESLAKSLEPKIAVQVENYPDLKTNQVYQQFMRDWKDTQENVTAAISVYNQTVQKFNDRLMMFPSSVINSVFLRRTRLDTFNDNEASETFEYKPNFKS